MGTGEIRGLGGGILVPYACCKCCTRKGTNRMGGAKITHRIICSLIVSS